MKIITYVVPCYNSAEYMDRCIKSLIPGGDDIEIVIVDDGSTKDDTPEKADAWVARLPDVIKVVHQPNKGHGGAINAGIDAATGVYFKVVDSDDWLDCDAAAKVLDVLRGFIRDGQVVDMVIADYVYEHVLDDKHHVIHYANALPQYRVFTWDEFGHFHPWQNLLMHSLIYRTEVLRTGATRLPEHCFYVDNIYAFQPYPFVKTLYYLHVPFYRYFIGRVDQSVNEQVMIGRLDQHVRVCKIMIDYEIEQKALVTSPRLRHVRESYLSMIMAIASSLYLVSGMPEDFEKRSELWRYMKRVDPELYSYCRWEMRNLGMNIPFRLGHRISLSFYHLARKIFKFN